MASPLRRRLGAVTATVLCALAVAPLATAGALTWGHGSWSWFGDPRAIHAGQATYVGWIGWNGEVTVGEYAPALGLVRQAVVAHTYHDDHSDPSLLLEPDGRLTVFWSGHNGTQMNVRTTVQPGDLSGWTPVTHVPQEIPGREGFTYPNPVLLPAEGNRVYLFWRGADWSADYATRAPNGTWSPAHDVIRAPGERPYLKVADDGAGRIALAFTNGHPRNVLTSIYYATYRHGSLWTADGRWIGRIAHGITPTRAQIVYDARVTDVGAWVWDVAFDRYGRPVIVYATFPTRRRHVYWYAAFDGRRWVSHQLTVAGGSISPGTIEYEYSGGITLDHADPSIVYLSRQVHGGWEIERWATSDGGSRWSHRTVVPSGGTDNVRPVVPRGSSGGPLDLLWLHGPYHSYTSYRTSILALLR